MPERRSCGSLTLKPTQTAAAMLHRARGWAKRSKLRLANVHYLRPLIQGNISVSLGSWFSPRSPEFRRIDIRRRGHPATVPIIARQAYRIAMLPRGGDVFTPGRAYSVRAISCRQLLFCPGEGRTVAPNAGHDDSQFSRRRNDGSFYSPSCDTRWIKIFAAS